MTVELARHKSDEIRKLEVCSAKCDAIFFA